MYFFGSKQSALSVAKHEPVALLNHLEVCSVDLDSFTIVNSSAVLLGPRRGLASPFLVTGPVVRRAQQPVGFWQQVIDGRSSQPADVLEDLLEGFDHRCMISRVLVGLCSHERVLPGNEDVLLRLSLELHDQRIVAERRNG